MKNFLFLLIIPIILVQHLTGDCVTVNPTDIENHFILVVDKSGSMDGKPIENIKSALYNFVADMKTDDKASLVFFDNQVRVRANHTSNKEQLYNRIENLDAGGGTALYDALGKASLLAHENRSQSIIVFFTDGIDNSSRLSVKNIESIARSQGIYIYGIGLGEIDRSALKEVARKTNGDFLYADNSYQLMSLYNDVLFNYYNFFDNSKQNKARLIVQSQPAKKAVFINGELEDQKTPVVIENLDPGTYSVVVKFDRGNWECGADLEGGFTGEINARENDLGRDIAVISDVKSAMVFLDDTFVGYTAKYPLVSETVKTGWFSSKKEFNFNKQLILENIPAGQHKIKIVGLSEMENFFAPLQTLLSVDGKDLIVTAEFLSNQVQIKETSKNLREMKSNSPYDNVEEVFDELD